VGALSQINTMKLTNEQIKQNGLAMIAFSEGKPIQFIASLNDAWQDYLHTVMMPDLTNLPFRPKPQPVSRPWSKPEDVPLNCWLRSPKYGTMHLVTQLANEGTRGHTLGRKVWSELNEYEYSTDRINWKPCTVEEQPCPTFATASATVILT